MMNKKITYILVGVAAAASMATANPTSGFRGIYNTAPATRWEDAFLSGNGDSGIMVYGDALDDTIVFNHHKFIRPKGLVHLPPDMTPALGAMRDKMLGGDIPGGWQDYYDYAMANGMNSLEDSQIFHPGFHLNIQHAADGAVQNYQHVCNYETGEVTVSWDDNRGSWVRKSFVSRDEDWIVTLIEKPTGASLDVTLGLEDAINHPGGFLVETPNSPQFLSFRCRYNMIDGKQGGYEGVTRVIQTGGSSLVDGSNNLQVSGADSVLLITKLERYKDDYQGWNAQALQAELDTITKNYDQLLADHTAIHTEMYNRVTYDVGASEADRARSAAELVANQNANKLTVNKALIEKVFDTSRYLFMCTSGSTFGPRLSGVFLGDWNEAGWNDDYIANVNYTLQIGGGNIANLAECMEGVFQLMERTKPDWEIGASRLWGCRGIVGPVRMDGERALFSNFDAFYAHAASVGYGPWLVYSMYEQYQISGDQTFLQDRVYPFLHDMAIFFEDFLSRTNESGDVIFVPSVSPESPPGNSSQSIASVNAVFDIAACKHGLNMAIEASNVLGLEQGAGEGVERWTALLGKIPAYITEPDGTLKEWVWDLGENYGHRHTSHAYTLWPAYEINPEDATTSGLIPAIKMALDKRPAPPNMPQAHGNLMLAYGEIRTKDGQRFGERLKGLFTNEHFFNSLATSHDVRLESVYNYDFINSIQGHLIESAVMTQPGVLELLPAMPSYLSKGTLTGVKGRNRTTIESLKWDLDVGTITCEFTSDIDQDLQLIVRSGMDAVVCSAPISGSGIYRTLSVTEDEPVTLRIEVGAAGSGSNVIQNGSFETGNGTRANLE